MVMAEPKIARAFLEIIIAETIIFFNVGKNMDTAQVGATIDLILGDFVARNLKPSDYKLIFTNGKKGHYNNGKMYDKFDGQVIFDWITQYANERADIYESNSVQVHSQQLTEEKRGDNSGWTADRLKQLKESLQMPQKKVVPVEVLKSDHTKLIQRFLSQFDKIHRDKPYKTSQGRFIYRYHKVMNQVEYSEYKLYQLKKIEILKHKKAKKKNENNSKN